jgi:hypothetical protein
LLYWYKSANTDAARRITDDAASIDDEEEMIQESQGLLDEEEVSAEEEERRMSSKVCSYTKPLNTFAHVCARMRPDAHVCTRMLTCAYVRRCAATRKPPTPFQSSTGITAGHAG